MLRRIVIKIALASGFSVNIKCVATCLRSSRDFIWVRSINKADVPRMTCSFTVSKFNTISMILVDVHMYKCWMCTRKHWL